jgi:hypothetical protein
VACGKGEKPAPSDGLGVALLKLVEKIFIYITGRYGDGIKLDSGFARVNAPVDISILRLFRMGLSKWPTITSSLRAMLKMSLVRTRRSA